MQWTEAGLVVEASKNWLLSVRNIKYYNGISFGSSQKRNRFKKVEIFCFWAISKFGLSTNIHKKRDCGTFFDLTKLLIKKIVSMFKMNYFLSSYKSQGKVKKCLFPLISDFTSFRWCRTEREETVSGVPPHNILP